MVTTRPRCTPRPLARRRGTRRAPRRDAVIGWEALSAAVALLTAERDGDQDLRARIAQDGSPDELIMGLQVMASAALQVLMPGDRGARALEGLGLLALERAAGAP